ncbi:MAG: replication-associated recombination protein A [Candidatus Mcinerneyibacterium aminivorans]|uniref:Replication-associated recombination protein A n=1 Tax=Candidatus Mcinerneyibacterium aminivorans TaxID=2703815 RepID=A0A5D0MGX2_9BACT|nr:MAG: replication-associated recombination protein A [Candidatus Mcinerneyibacterium aminivorans]
MTNIFDSSNRPLYEIIRPKKIDDFYGQNHLVGENGVIAKYLEKNRIFSSIFYGPPGTGKTTLAKIIARKLNANFVYFNAVETSIGDIRKAVKRETSTGLNIFFVDEIHKFNKKQQMIFLPYLESGQIKLLATTTQNPNYNIIPPLKSRVKILKFNKLEDETITQIIEDGLKYFDKTLREEHKKIIINYADGDGRFALFLLEEIIFHFDINKVGVEEIRNHFNKNLNIKDTKGDFYYNYLSALHKSLRGSDADAAVYWITVMIETGIDPRAILRRMLAFASEDVGLADPNALGIVKNAYDTYEILGLPEGRLAIYEAAIYLAITPKSNSVYEAGNRAKEILDKYGIQDVPSNIGSDTKSYKYPHNYDDYLIKQDYLPEKISGKDIVKFNTHGKEKRFKKRWEYIKSKIKKND